VRRSLSKILTLNQSGVGWVDVGNRANAGWRIFVFLANVYGKKQKPHFLGQMTVSAEAITFSVIHCERFEKMHLYKV
jgi:hypothetical protein